MKANYDKWKLHNPDDDLKVFCTCDHCGNEIFRDDEYLTIDDATIHEGCFEDYSWDILSPVRKIADKKE